MNITITIIVVIALVIMTLISKLVNTTATESKTFIGMVFDFVKTISWLLGLGVIAYIWIIA